MKSPFTGRRSALQFLFALLVLAVGSFVAFRAVASGESGGHTGQALSLGAVLHPAGVPALPKALLNAHTPLRKALVNAHAPAAKARSVMQVKPAAATAGPPLLDPYTAGLTGEVIHVTDTSGNIIRNGQVAPGGQVKFTVRLTPQANLIDDNNVYIQIKDPDSIYQDAQGREHKVFTQDLTDFTNANGLSPSPSNGDSGSASTYLYNGGNGNAPGYFTINGNLFGFPQRGAVGGYDTATSQPITVGRTGGGTNPVVTGTPPAPLPGDNPALFTTFGQEYECQFVNAHFTGPDTTATDYGTPYYLAGVDDQVLGSAPAPRAEWLRLTGANLVGGVNQPDADGSYRYTATWTTPTSPSDYYLDVIAYDTARNWRIYDNVWGFSTLAWNSNPTLYPNFSNANDILVVSDNTLGQKFVASTNFQNLQPTFYGVESYFTDIDVNRLPDAAYTLVQDVSNAPPDPEVIPFTFSQAIGHVLNGLGVGSYSGHDPAMNPDLDPVVDRFNNPAIDAAATSNTTTIATHLVPRSQKYVIWRTLSRGPLDPDVLNAYSGTTVSQGGTTVPVATRCVIWVSPYANSIPLNAQGSLSDQRTQDLLRAYMQGGTIGTTVFPGVGRLFVTGPTIANVLSQEGSTTFLSDILNAGYTGSAVGGNQLTDVSDAPANSPNRITHDAYVNFLAPPTFGEVAMNFYTDLQMDGFHYQQPSVSALIPGNDFIKVLAAGNRLDEPPYRTDGSLADLGPINSTFGSNQNSILGTFDFIVPTNGAHIATRLGTEVTHNNLVYSDTTTGSLAGGSGSRSVFASFGLDEIGIEYVRKSFTVGSTTVVDFANLNQRPNILHNIVCYLRTGTFTGTIAAGNSALGISVGQPIPNATVTLTLQPNGTTLPGTTYSTTTDANGRYILRGVEPGAYVVSASKPGFQSSSSNSGLQGSSVPFTVEGDTSTGDVNLNLNVLPVGRIVGTVTDATTGIGIANASLIFTSTDGFYTVTGTSGADGTYTIDGVIPDTYTGIASAGGFKTSDPSAPVTVPSGAASPPVDFALVPIPGTASGRVFERISLQNISGVTLSFKNNATNVVTTTTTFPTSATSTAPNYSVSLEQGTYTVTLTGIPQYYSNPQPAYAQITVVSGTPITVPDFTLDSTLGTLTGTVADAAGNGIPNATVTITQTDAGTSNTQTVTTDSSGVYGPVNLTAGTYKIVVAATNFLTKTITGIAITAHNQTTQNVTLISTLGTLGGLVTDASQPGRPLAGAVVTVTDASGAQVSGSPFTTTSSTRTSPTDVNGTTDTINYPSSGAVSLPVTDANGTPIPYTITVTDQGSGTSANPRYNSQTITPVLLTVGKFTPANFALVNASGTLTGLVTDSYTHQPLSGATVSVADSTGSVVATVITTSDGTLNYSIPLYENTTANPYYTVSATASNHAVSSQRVTITGSGTTRQDLALISTQGTLGGLVADAFSNQPVAGVTVTLTQTNTKGITTTVATFETTSATTTPPTGLINTDTNPINYSGTLTQGTYTVSIARRGYGSPATRTVTISPNTFTRADFTGSTNGLPPIHTFAAGYNFFSVPYDYSSLGVGFDDLFGTLNTGTKASPSAGSNRSHIFVWSPQLLQYVLDPQAPADALRLGQGYWVYLISAHEVTVAGTAATAKSIPVSLHQGWNQIGVPSLSAISVANITFTNGATGGTISFANASTTFRLVSSPLYGYDGSNYYTITGTGTLQPWQSYWIYAYSDVTANIPTS